MINQNRTWKLRWKVLALIAVLCIGVATLTDAQERRSVAEIRAEIEPLIAELREAAEAEGITDDPLLAGLLAQEADIVPEVWKAYTINSNSINLERIIAFVNEIVSTARVVTLAESNEIHIFASPEEHVVLARLLDQFSDRQPKTYHLGAVQPHELNRVSSQIQTAMQGRVMVMPGTTPGDLVVIGTPAEHERIEVLLEHLLGGIESRGEPTTVVYDIAFLSHKTDAEKTRLFANFAQASRDISNFQMFVIPTMDSVTVAGSATAHERFVDFLRQLQHPQALPEREPAIVSPRDDGAQSRALELPPLEPVFDPFSPRHRPVREAPVEVPTTLEAYPFRNVHDVPMRIIRQLVPRVTISYDSNLRHFLVQATPAEHELVREILEQLREGIRGDVDWETIPNDKLLFRLYDAPTRIEVIEPFLGGIVTRDVLMFHEDPPRNTTFLSRNSFLIYGRKADHERVRNMIEQVQKITDEIAETRLESALVAERSAARRAELDAREGVVVRQIQLTHISANDLIPHFQNLRLRDAISTLTISSRTDRTLEIRGMPEDVAILEAKIAELDVPGE